MTVSTHYLPSLPHVPVQPRRLQRPGLRDWIMALAWTTALVAAHLLLFTVVIVLVALR